MDDFSHTARVYMAEKILNDHVLVRDDIGYNLLLLAVYEQLHNFAEISCKDRVDRLFILCLGEFEEAIEEHIFSKLFIVLRFIRIITRANSRCLGSFTRIVLFSLRLVVKSRLLRCSLLDFFVSRFFWRV